MTIRLYGLAPLLLAAALAACDSQPQENQPSSADIAAPARGVDRSKAGQPAPHAAIRNADGEETSLAELAGEPVLVNLWATWCAPCVKELPTLQALAGRAGAPRVIAVSEDFGERAPVDAFLDQNRLRDLEVWHDPEMALSGATGAPVLPTTILYDAKGREVWRFVGDLDWTGAEAARLLAEPAPAAAR